MNTRRPFLPKIPRATNTRWLAAIPIVLLIGAGLWFLKGQGSSSKNSAKGERQSYEEKVENYDRYQRALTWYDRAEKKRKADKPKAAFKLYDKAAAIGDPYINKILIDRYMSAKDGFDYDFDKAETLIRALPENQQGPPLLKLAWQHENGARGLTVNEARAAELLELALSAGYAPASMRLFNFYSNTRHQLPYYDPEKALGYIDHAIANTDNSAPRIIKAKYLFTQNDENSRNQAISLLEQVLETERRNVSAIEMIGDFYYTRDQDGDRRKAMRYYNRLETPIPLIIYRKAEILRINAQTQGDWIEARDHYVIAATARHTPSVMMMGHIHRLGLADEVNLDAALSFYEALSDSVGNPAGHFIGAIYQSGDWPNTGGKPDYAKAKDAYQSGINVGVPAAKVMMARLYEKGHGVPKDESKAHALMEDAALDGSNLARAGMADYFERGIGVKRNFPMARIWKGHIRQPEDPRIFTCDLCDPKTD